MRKPLNLSPCGQGSRKIQLPYTNNFETIWEYKEVFFSLQVSFRDTIGTKCPICDNRDCYQEIDPYWRYAIELLPEFRKEKVPVARFLCQKKKATFSLLPIQLIPYFQYTAGAVIWTLFCGLSCWKMGQVGFYGAQASANPDGNVTAWIVFYWLAVMVKGFRRGHAELMALYDLSCIRTSETTVPWQEFRDYVQAFGIDPDLAWQPELHILLYRYSQRTRLFLLGTPSQHRLVRA